MKKERVLVAFSGGLDTSYCVKYLKEERGMEVYSALVNTGGFYDEELKELDKKAKELGAVKHVNINRKEEFYNKGIRYMIYGNILKNNTYPLSVSSERIFQALAIADYAKEIDADYIAHGCTGAGNDQVRFDLVFRIVAPEMKIIAPIREMKLSRQKEIDYLSSHGCDYSWEKSKYSINKGLWGTSIGGDQTLTSDKELPDEAFPTPVTKSGSEYIEIDFVKGEPIGLNGDKMPPIEVIEKLHRIAAPYGIGRDMHVGDTILGIKGRIGFEAAAPLIIIKAHHLLEKHVLTKWQQEWKDNLSKWYGMMLHEAQYLEPTMRDIEKFLESTQKNVTGKVKIKLMPYHFSLVGCSSQHDLMDSRFGDYGEESKAFTGEDVVGFTNILSNQMRIYHSVNKERDE